jgi:hypothetical protein
MLYLISFNSTVCKQLFSNTWGALQGIQLEVEQYQLATWMAAAWDIDCQAFHSTYSYTASSNTVGCHMLCVTHVNCLSWFMNIRTVYHRSFLKYVNCCFCCECAYSEIIFIVKKYIRKKSYKKCCTKFRRLFRGFSFPLKSTIHPMMNKSWTTGSLLKKWQLTLCVISEESLMTLQCN